MASKKTLKSSRKRKPKSTSKRKPKSIREILAAKGVPKLELTKAEERIIHNEQEKYVKKLMEREIDELRQLLKPRLDLEKAMQEAGPDSPLAQAVKDMSPKARRYAEDHLGFRAPPRAREAASTALRSGKCDVSVLTPPYSKGHPISEEVGDDVTGAHAGSFKTSSALAIPSAGTLSVGVANGRWVHTDWPSSHNWPGGDANSARASIFHFLPFSVPEPSGFTLKNSMEVTIDVIVGDPVRPPVHPFKLEPPSLAGLVGVMGVMSLTLGGDQETWAPRTNTKTFLLRTVVPPGATPLPVDDIDLEQFSLSETLVLKPGATWAAVNVLASLRAFRVGVGVPHGLTGFSAIDLRTQDPSIPTHAIAPYQLAAGPIIIDTMCIALCPLASELARF